MRTDEEATSSAIAFALAGVLFIAAISTVLVYANDRIPPPSKSQPHDELSAEARVLLQTLVLANGNGAWTGAAWADPTQAPGLKCATCTTSVKLDHAKVLRLDTDLDYTYESLRAAIDLAEGRDFRITVTDTGNGTVYLDKCQEDAVLAGTDRCVNPATATRPAVVFLTTTAGSNVRVAVHVFLTCDEGACLA